MGFASMARAVNYPVFGAELQGSQTNDYLGSSVAMSGNGGRIALSAKGNNGGSTGEGQVQVFDWTTTPEGTSWTLAGSAMLGGVANAGSWGVPVSMSADGTRVLAYFKEAGKARVYHQVAGAWTLLGAEFTFVSERWFDATMSKDGNHVAFAIQSSGAKVRSYQYTGGAWVPSTFITNPAGVTNFAASLALSADGSVLAIGSTNSGLIGEVDIYHNTGGAWGSQKATFLGVASDDSNGFSVAMSDDGSRVVVGAPRYNGEVAASNNGVGMVRVFDWHAESSTFSLGGTIVGTVGGLMQVGASVAISGDGHTILVGGGTSGRGSAVYKLVLGKWAPVNENQLSGVDWDQTNIQGKASALSHDGERFIIGGYLSGAQNQGAAYNYANAALTATEDDSVDAATWPAVVAGVLIFMAAFFAVVLTKKQHQQ